MYADIYMVSQKRATIFFFGILDTFQSCPKGSNRDQYGQPNFFDLLRPYWAHQDHSGPFQTKMIFCPKWKKWGLAEVLQSKKTNFVWNDGPKRVPIGQKHLWWLFWSLLDPFGQLWNVSKIPKAVQSRTNLLLLFFGTPCILFVVEAANELLCKMLGDSSGVDLDVCIPLMDCYDY